MNTVTLLLLPRFQMLAYVLATETLRLANKAAGRALLDWETVSATDVPVAASNGATVAPDKPLAEAASRPALLLVCAGYDPLENLTQSAAALVRRAARHGVPLGGLDTGTVVLARLGLLAGYRAVVHFEAEAGFRETFPDIQLSDAIYCLDRDRLTAAGGTSTGDALLAWIGARHGPDIAEAAAVAMVHGRVRPMDEPQLAPPRSALVAAVVADMKHAIGAPLPIDSLAKRRGLSARALAARFKRDLGQTPGDVYLGLRLDHARDLLASTDLSAAEVGLASGFGSKAWFSTAYARRFGLSPGKHRRLL